MKRAETLLGWCKQQTWIVCYYCPHCRMRVWMDLVYVGVGSCTRCSVSISKADALCQSLPAGEQIPRWLP